MMTAPLDISPSNDCNPSFLAGVSHQTPPPFVLAKNSALSRSAHSTAPPSALRDENSNSDSSTSPDTLRVLHLINGEHFSGAERVQQLLGQRLGEFGVSADFLCLKPDKFPTCSGLPASRVFSQPMQGKFDLKVVPSIAEKVRDSNYHIIHAHTPRSAMIAALVSKQCNIPWVYHVHSPTARDSTRSLTNRVNDWVEKWSIRKCNHLITVSKSLRREMLQKGWKRNQVTAIHNGVPALSPINPELRLQSSTWRLGMVALLRPRKGTSVLIDAMRLVAQQATPITLDLIGPWESPEYQQEIMLKIEQYRLQDCVRWQGFTDDVPAALSKLDALVLPSLFGEGLPMVVLEAMSCGVPVIATQVEGTPEAVIDHQHGFLAQPSDARGLAQSILRLASDRNRWAEFSQNCVSRHRASFSDIKMAERTAKLYRRICQG